MTRTTQASRGASSPAEGSIPILRNIPRPSAFKLLDLIPNGGEAEELPHPQGCVVLLHALVPQGRVQAGCRGVVHVDMQMHALVSAHVSRGEANEKESAKEGRIIGFREQDGSFKNTRSKKKLE